MIRTTRLATTVIAAGVLAGCATGTPAEPDPSDDRSDDQTPCIVGEWKLDVPDYSVQSEAYVLGLGIPIVDFAMEGVGTIRFTADGLVASDIDLTTTGTIVAGDTHVPLNSQSSYNGTGDWSDGDDLSSIDLENWANVPDPAVPTDPSSPPIPAIDYTDVPAVMAFCTSKTLILQAPGAPYAAQWHR
ncbi:MAG: hypothetical protein KF801_09325 [Cryobacterium sp.]|jgi:hypothetical protein|nr:hypothetical protein [Cryobacterium sp.]